MDLRGVLSKSLPGLSRIFRSLIRVGAAHLTSDLPAVAAGERPLPVANLEDLSGAFSNSFVTDKSLLIRRVYLRRTLLDRAAERPLKPRPALPRAAPVLETVT